MKRKLWLIPILLLSFAVQSYAATSTDEKIGLHYIRKGTFFTNYDAGTSFGTTTGYVYESPNLTSVNDGWIDIPAGKRTVVQVGIDTFASGTITVQIQGITYSDSKPCEIVTLYYTAATTIDVIIP